MRKENFMSTLPSVLADDENLRALAQAAAAALEASAAEREMAAIYNRIDSLPEEVLDILAYDFKVDWWDFSLTLSEKRETLKRSWYVHRHMATPAAVESALTAVYADTECTEWHQYGGKPYHFRLAMTVPAEDMESTKHERVMELLRYYKNLRSVLDHILYIIKTPLDLVLHADSIVGRGLMSTVLPEIPYTPSEEEQGKPRFIAESISDAGTELTVGVLGVEDTGDTLTVTVRAYPKIM